MRLLITDYKFYYFGGVANIRYIDSENKETPVVFELLNSEKPHSWSSQTDNRGVCDTELNITKDLFRPGKTYYLKATCNSIVSKVAFGVSYKAVIIEKILEHLLQGFRNIPVYDELAVLHPSKMEASFTYKNWVWTEERTFYKNDNIPLTEFVDLYPDYQGKIYISDPSSILDGDEIFGSYTFRYFTDLDFSAALEYAVNTLNISPPVTSYNIENCPVEYNGVLVYAAYSFLLEKVLNDTLFWNQSFVFRNADQLRADLSARISQAKSEVSALLSRKVYKVVPVGISSYKFSVPFKIDQTNWRYLTIASITLQ